MTAPAPGGKRYQTRQKELVLACLRATPDAYLTARQVVERLAEEGCRVGTATVYRNLERLEAEGLIAKSTVEGTGGTSWRYLADAPETQTGCFYLKCERCGQLTPVGCSELGHFYEHFAREHHIRIDPVKTVLFGTCSTCLDAEDTTAR